MPLLYRCPAGSVALSVAPRLASWDRAGSPGQIRLSTFLSHIEAEAEPLIAAINGRLSVELTVGLPESTPLTSGGRDLDNYLYPIAQRLGGQRGISRNPRTGSSGLACSPRPAFPWYGRRPSRPRAGLSPNGCAGR